MKLKQLLLAAVASVAVSSTASAAILTSTNGSAANVVTDYSMASQVAFDLDLVNSASTRVNFMLEEGDLLGPLSMNALVRNLSGKGLTDFTFSLEGITFSAAGSVTPTFGTIDQVVFKPNAAMIDFGTPEFAEFHFGNPFSSSSMTNWFFDTTGMRAGDRFVITAAVPEPSTISLLLAALAMFAMAAARGRNKH